MMNKITAKENIRLTEVDSMTITEVSKKYDISQDTLRYYERIGLIPAVKRTKGGMRDYSEESCGWIELAKCMRSAGIPIEALIEYCALAQQGDQTITARKELLVEERTKLLEKMEDMKKTLDKLNYKIDIYEKAEVSGVLSWEKPNA
jgi:DNA-binding transcriptional MerR regulator